MSMRILDLQTGETHIFGDNCHDSLAISQDGRSLHYYNLQCGDGSNYGDFRFVMEDNKVPSESGTADAIHVESYFNIGGWTCDRNTKLVPDNNRPATYKFKCLYCGGISYYHTANGKIRGCGYNFCPWCGRRNAKEKTDEE